MSARRALRFVFALCCALALAAPAGARQETAQAPKDAAPAQAPAAEAPTAEALDARLKELQARQDLEPALRDELVQRYQKASTELAQARTWRERKLEQERLAAEAPALLASIREELAQPPEEPRIELDPAWALKDVEARAEEARAQLEQAQKLADELKAEAARRGSRSSAIPAELQEARARLAPLLEARKAPPPPGQDPLVTEASTALVAAQIASLEAEVSARESELASIDARASLLPARRDRAQRRLLQAEKLANAWREQVAAARQREADAAAAAARAKRLELAARFPALRELAERTEALALERSGAEGVSSKLERAEQELSERRGLLERLRARSQRVRDRLRASARSTALGALLRKEYDDLPRVDPVERRLDTLATQSAAAQYRLIELEEERAEAGDPARRVQLLLTEARARGEVQPAEQAEFEAFATELYTAERERIEALQDDYEEWSDALLELSRVSSALVKETLAYREQIEEHILWVRSVPEEQLLGFLAAGPALAWLLDPLGWSEALARALGDARRHWAGTALWLVVLLLALYGQRRGLADLKELAPQVARYKSDRFSLTLRALLDTALAALPVPLALWCAGELLEVPNDAQADVASAVGAGLREAALSLLPALFLAKALRPKGLAEAHFRWNPASIAKLRRNLRWFVPVAAVGVALVTTLEGQGEEEWKNSLGRLTFMAGMLPFALFAQRVLQPGGAVLSPYLRANPDGLLARSRYVLLVVGVLMPLAFAVLAGLGYYYSALQLQGRLKDTLVLVVVLVFANAVADRWLFLARRRLAVEQALKRRREKPAPTVPTESGTEGEPEEQVDIPAINAATKKLFRTISGLVLVLGVFAIWGAVMPALRALEDVRLWPRLEIVDARASRQALESAGAPPLPTSETAMAPAAPVAPVAEGPAVVAPQLPGVATVERPRGGDEPEHVVDLADVLLALLLLGLTWIAGQNLPALLEMGLLQRLPLDAGARYAVKTVARYTLTIVGVTAAFGALGIGWAKVQWLAAALTFGLAFGLQEIFANFVSGLILLFERPIRLDDIVKLGDVEGRVARIRMRATTILDWDRRELLVPNKDFLTSHLINYTLTDPMSRYVLKVGVAYGSDTRLACELLLDCARKCEWVIADPAPSATFMNFGDSALLLELRVFMATRDHFLSLVDDMHRRVDQAFRDAGIEIAFPQLDLHLRSTVGGAPPAEVSGEASTVH